MTIFEFLYKGGNFYIFLKTNLIKIYPKTHQIAAFKKNYRGAYPQTPLAKHMTSLYYVQCTKYQYLNLIRETSQLDLDRCLTSTITQFIAHFKYTIIAAYNPVCNKRNCYVCERLQ